MLLAIAAASCLAVAPQADHVLARDLAPAFPALRQAPPDAAIGFAPAAGAVRTFSVGELARLATRLGVSGAAPDTEICVERPMSPLTSDTLLGAMRKALPDAQIELVDFSRISVPAGDLEFRSADLHAGPVDGTVWRGAVRFAGNRRAPVWAKVKVTATVTRVIAVGDIPAGQAIGAGLIVARTEKIFPTAEAYASSVAEVAGKLARVMIRAGSAVRVEDLQTPQDVMRGDPVKVIVRSGATRIELDGTAEGSGSIGARIPVRNPNSSRIFLGRVESKGVVTVDAPAWKGIE